MLPTSNCNEAPQTSNNSHSLDMQMTTSPDHSILHESDTKIASVRAIVLDTILRNMPITTLFTPEIRINLDTFIKDQMLIHRIAAYIYPLLESGSFNKESIAKRFENSRILDEIQALIKPDPSAYLGFIYEACFEALQNKSTSKNLKMALEGRIFTLKNALIAQKTPDTIRSSQIQHKISPQSNQNIMSGGANFIQESLRQHLQSLKQAETSTFRELLVATTEALLPFVQKITRMYLHEKNKNCPDNPLTFRDPTGYNHHGFIAATILESSLNALGYQTRLLGRSDLDPRVNLATAHNIIEVTDPDHLRYMIDPTYIQFHKDVYLDDALLPKAPVLVLAETEIDNYIEDHIMVQWKNISQLVRKKDATTKKKLEARDQLTSFVFHEMNFPKGIDPLNPEEWVRDAFKRVWVLSTYMPIFSDVSYHEIFNGTGSAQKTYDYIKSIGIASLTSHVPISEVENTLKSLLLDPRLLGKNSFESLSLIAHLPLNKKAVYKSLLDLDPRIDTTRGVGFLLNAYFRSLKKIVNPESAKKSVIYGCSGADCMTVLLATDAQELTFIDLTKVTYREFEDALNQLKSRDHDSNYQLLKYLQNDLNFLSRRSIYGGSSSTYLGENVHRMNNLALKLLFDLREMGVELNKVTITENQDTLGVRIEFPWKYHGAPDSMMRSVTLVNADITKPATYPASLKSKLKEGFDIFYMKAAFLAPMHYPDFLPSIVKHINKGGWLMTADKTSTMDVINPERCLQESALAVSIKKTKETTCLEELMMSEFDPFFTVPYLRLFPNDRKSRLPGSDLTYWSILSLRQVN